MNYELAKELKEAGFPTPNDGDCFNGSYICECSMIKGKEGNVETLGTDHKNAYAPTLSELIEACGKDIWTIKQCIFEGEWGWIVGQDNQNDENFSISNPYNWNIFAFGETLEVAVARLYIELKKK